MQIGSIYMVSHPDTSVCILLVVLLMYLATGYMGLITCLEFFSGWEHFPLFGRFGYVEMIRVLTIKVLHLCRLSTCVHVRYIYGRLYNVWRIKTYLRRCVHTWSTLRGILLPNMDGSMILELALL